MFVYGDIHGDWDWMRHVHGKQKRDPCAIQVGDFGVGFPADCRQDFAYLNEDERTYPPEFPNTFGFIAGNHDNPDLCRTHPNCLGDYGYLEDGDIFYVRGAYSVDKAYRTVGIDWWDNEELSWDELNQMVELFAETKPRYVVSHTCPARLYNTGLIRGALMASFGKQADRTSEALELARVRHQPVKWFFGHFHKSGQVEFSKTKFYAIGIQQRVEVAGVSFKLPTMKE